MTANETSLWRQGREGCLSTRDEDGCSLGVFPQSDRWCWTALRPTGDWYRSASGWTTTEAEARRAAIDAARRMTDER
jgi:hypothetical protein